MSSVELNFRYGTVQYSNTPGPELMIEAFLPANALERLEIIAILDTGSVITCLPNRVLARLEPQAYNYITVVTALGHEQTLKTYFVGLRVSGVLLKIVEVVGCNRPYGIIGRDILNELHLTLRGYEREWSVRGNAKTVLD